MSLDVCLNYYTSSQPVSQTGCLTLPSLPFVGRQVICFARSGPLQNSGYIFLLTSSKLTRMAITLKSLGGLLFLLSTHQNHSDIWWCGRCKMCFNLNDGFIRKCGALNIQATEFGSCISDSGLGYFSPLLHFIDCLFLRVFLPDVHIKQIFISLNTVIYNTKVQLRKATRFGLI